MEKSMRGQYVRLVLMVWFVLASAPSFANRLDPAFTEPLNGPETAKGAVIWSHGRSISAEDYKSPTPQYLQMLRDDGWDVMRFDRLARDDTLSDSTNGLIKYTASLKHSGYKQVVLAGQSFGAFLSLMAADGSSEVDAVIATAPAAYGSFEEFYDSWRLNASRLYPLLEQVKRARVMVFYFHGDNFDPGGRGERSREILSGRGLGFAVIDQPAYLMSHYAASSGLFLRRFGRCIRDFANNEKLSGEHVCKPVWGTMPSNELKLPAYMADSSTVRAAASTAPTGSGTAEDRPIKPGAFRDVWYGFYPNGREVLLGIEEVQGDHLTAIYALGPSVDNKNLAIWSRRKGRIVEKSFVFEESGKSTLRFRPRHDGRLDVTWVSINGNTSMATHLRSIDPKDLLNRSHALE